MFNTTSMNIRNANNVPYLSFKSLDKIDFIKSAVSTRHGGVSTGKKHSSLNLGTSTKDNWDNIVKNYHIFCSATGFDIETLVLAKQTHSDNVRVVDYSDAGKGVLKERDYNNIDALVTNKKNLPLVIHTADCVPVAFVDTKNKAIGNAHCGWRGTYSALSQKTLDVMKKTYGTNPEDVVVAIGPCICRSCYEVSKELFDDFKIKFPFSQCLVVENEKYFIDLPGLNREILLCAGVAEENITVCDICTCCNKEDMFSHRGLGPERGILASIISLV